MKTKAAQRLAPAVIVGGILTALAWGANAQEPAASAATPATTTTQEQTAFDEKVNFHPGIPRLRGVNMCASDSFSDEDLRVLGTEWKANLVRWVIGGPNSPTRNNRDLAEYDRSMDAELDKLDKGLDVCRRYGMKVVVDMFEPGGRHANTDTALLYEPQYQDHLVAVWEKIARRYKGNPTIWAYNPISEPVQSAPLPKGMPDWLGAQVRVAKAIRAIDPDVPVFIEVGDADSPATFSELKPVVVPNVIYQVHMYEPGLYTHQGVTRVFGIWFTVAYPGKMFGGMWDKEQLRRVLQPVRDFQLAHHVGIYVGEFGVIRWAPGACNYLRDCIELFEEYGWDWSYLCFRGWDGWSTEHGSDPQDHRPVKEPTDREKLLLSWFAKNVQPAREVGAPAKQ